MDIGAFSVWHWLIVLVVVVVVFGTGKLRDVGGDLGAAIKGFKKAMNEGETDKSVSTEQLLSHVTGGAAASGAAHEAKADTAEAPVGPEAKTDTHA